MPVRAVTKRLVRPGYPRPSHLSALLMGLVPHREGVMIARENVQGAWNRWGLGLITQLFLGCCTLLAGCGQESRQAAAVNWAEVESKVDPKLLVKKSGKNFVPVEREERRRILNQAKQKPQE